VRIVSGTHKGRQIPVRKNFPSRPTTDFAKENLFNILQNYFDLDGLEVLDLFAGTGNISYEFASRGSIVKSIELNFRSFHFIQETAKELALSRLTVVKADVFRFLEKTDKRWDIIFADPPFDLEDIEHLPDLIFRKELLKRDGWFILEHSDQKKFDDHPYLREKRSYGSVNFSIFK
jgi:16S rRNA (guanine966-N2)-methyltransferase